MIIEFLGTGTSHGIPVLSCHCAVCRSTDPANIRFRSSLYIRGDSGESILIDCGPEFRLQALRAGIDRLDAVLLTHAHADHLHGLDDLRPLSRRRKIKLYANSVSGAELRRRFRYAFPGKGKKQGDEGGGNPRFRLNIVEEPFKVGAIRISPIPLKHGSLDISGWRMEEGSKTLVYASDVKYIEDTSCALMKGADILILGALRSSPHSTHFSFEEALAASRELAAGSVWFTHFSHEHSHRDIVRLIAPDAAPARDTLRLIL